MTVHPARLAGVIWVTPIAGLRHSLAQRRADRTARERQCSAIIRPLRCFSQRSSWAISPRWSATRCDPKARPLIARRHLAPSRSAPRAPARVAFRSVHSASVSPGYRKPSAAVIDQGPEQASKLLIRSSAKSSFSDMRTSSFAVGLKLRSKVRLDRPADHNFYKYSRYGK